MRRTEQEFKAEVFRRSSEFKRRRKEQTKKIFISLGCIAVLILAVPMLPVGFGGSSMDTAAAVMDFKNNAAPQAPEAAAEQKSESMQYAGNGAHLQDAEPEDGCPEEGISAYEVRVTLIHPDGTGEEWTIRGEERINAVMNGIQAFRDADSSKAELEGISETEGNTVYNIFYLDNNELYSFDFYADHDALFFNYDGGYWVGQDPQAARELMDALQKE